MPVYFIAEIQEVKDKQSYSKYAEAASEIVKKYGGKYHVRGGSTVTFFGDWKPGRLIIVEFENQEQLQKCFQSAEYRAIAPLRENATTGRAITVEGV
jgi:uncharacterized protein (DUF1330 family)